MHYFKDPWQMVQEGTVFSCMDLPGFEQVVGRCVDQKVQGEVNFTFLKEEGSKVNSN